FLALGKSETVGASSDLFQLRDREHKIYTRLTTAASPALARSVAAPGAGRGGATPPAAAVRRGDSPIDVEREAERILLGRYAPASGLVDEGGQGRQLRRG